MAQVAAMGYSRVWSREHRAGKRMNTSGGKPTVEVNGRSYAWPDDPVVIADGEPSQVLADPAVRKAVLGRV